MKRQTTWYKKKCASHISDKAFIIRYMKDSQSLKVKKNNNPVRT